MRHLHTLLFLVTTTAACSTAEASREGEPRGDADQGTASKDASKGASAKSGAAPAVGGALDVKVDDTYATKLKVGAAFVKLFPRDEDEDGTPGAYKFYLTLFNEGVKGATCETEPNRKEAVGGTDWALSFDTLNDNQWQVGSKEPLELSPTFFYKDQRGEPTGLAPWSSVSLDKNEVHIESLTSERVTFRFDLHNESSGGEGWIRGKVTAKVCKSE
jgi:hypothetical protein